MHRAWTTLGPMLAAAALILWGGERLARRTVEDRIPADRVRLFDFASLFRQELDRLAELYNQHLETLCLRTAQQPAGPDLNKLAANLVGVRTVVLFHAGKKQPEITGTKPPIGAGLRVPPVETDDSGLLPRNAVVLGKSLLEDDAPGHGWLTANDGAHRVYWQRFSRQQTVAVVIDDAELQEILARHLEQWSASPLRPLRESAQLVRLEGPGARVFEPSQDPMAGGLAALTLPHRTSLGEWQVLAWDRLKIRTEHDTATLVMACGIATALLLAGLYLQIQQGRALKLAEERVSFVNRVSHELGTPLTNILLNLELTGRNVESRPGEARRRLKLVDEEVRRLGRLVSNVLTFSRGERKTLELRPRTVVADEIVDELLHHFEPSLERSGIHIERDLQATDKLQLDPDALSQIVGNLISNVEKYAATGGWLGIESRIEDGRLKIRVADAGPGVPARARERIFEAFERISSRVDEGVSGTGLGLAIARDLARRMGGSLELSPASSSGGAVFELQLPATTHLTLLHTPAA